jgi:DNA invertase Pin-like site-specific DNA recombinase
MIAAIFARKSTDQNGVADEAKSVTRQIDRARQCAESKGWLLDDRFIFVDDGRRRGRSLSRRQASKMARTSRADNLFRG